MGQIQTRVEKMIIILKYAINTGRKNEAAVFTLTIKRTKLKCSIYVICKRDTKLEYRRKARPTR